MKRYVLYPLILCLSIGVMDAQTLEDYIREGLESNLVIQQKETDVARARQALQEAKALFLPMVDFNATFITGDGGRSIDIPIGDLLNPVYATLNAITQLPLFPQIENVQQNFFPRNQHDIKLRTSMALFNNDLLKNKEIQSGQVEMKTTEVLWYKRDLVMQIKQAYYQYLMAVESRKIYESALKLVEQSVRVNESLLGAGKAVPAQLLRAKSEMEQVKAQLIQAERQADNARAYFNFLLNKPAASPVNVAFDTQSALGQALVELSPKVDAREELKYIIAGKGVLELQYRLQRQFQVPKIGAFVDLGSQAEELRFNRKSLYYFAGVQMEMPLFQRPQKYRMQQTKLRMLQTDQQLDYTRTQIDLALNVAQNNLLAAREKLAAAKVQNEAANSYYRLIEKGYGEGIFTQIEWLDARNQLTLSEIQINMLTFQILMHAAEVERQAATYSLEK